MKEIVSGSDMDRFKEFHRFVFMYHLFKPGERTLDILSAESILTIELYNRFPVCKSFIEFMKSSKKETINKDQWELMIDVFTIITNGDKYDVDSSCM